MSESKARIVIEFSGLYAAEQARNRVDEVRQLFMCRNPLEEPLISVEERPLAWLPLSEHAQEVLGDIFANSERPDKMQAAVDPLSHTITIQYEDLDEEWFNEFAAALR